MQIYGSIKSTAFIRPEPNKSSPQSVPSSTSLRVLRDPERGIVVTGKSFVTGSSVKKSADKRDKEGLQVAAEERTPL